jgi:Domain of unknown function (DUF5664)
MMNDSTNKYNDAAGNSKFYTSKSGAMREKMNDNYYDLIPFREIVDSYKRVAEFGAKKYTPWNWAKGLPRVQLIGSLLNHTWAYLRGEDKDKDSGLSHVDHILWNAVALVHNIKNAHEDGRRLEGDYQVKDENIFDDVNDTEYAIGYSDQSEVLGAGGL